MATVLYPGSFDPLHLGHIDVIEQSVALFGKVIVGVMHNPTKPSGMFSLAQRKDMIRASISYLPSVKVMAFEGLAVDAVKQVKAAFIVKGLRTGGDFEVEQQMAHTNHAVSGVRTVYLQARAGVDQQPLHSRDRAVRWRRHLAGPRSGCRRACQVVPRYTVARHTCRLTRAST